MRTTTIYTYYLNILTGELRRSDKLYPYYQYVPGTMGTKRLYNSSHETDLDMWYRFKHILSLVNPAYKKGELAKEEQYFTLRGGHDLGFYKDPPTKVKVFLNPEQIEYRTVEMIKQKFNQAL